MERERHNSAHLYRDIKKNPMYNIISREVSLFESNDIRLYHKGKIYSDV